MHLSTWCACADQGIATKMIIGTLNRDFSVITFSSYIFLTIP